MNEVRAEVTAWPARDGGWVWTPVRRAEDGEGVSLLDAVGQSLGAASACWEHLERAGVFDSTRCAAVYDWLMAYLGIWADEAEARRRAGALDRVARWLWRADAGGDDAWPHAGELRAPFYAQAEELLAVIAEGTSES